MRALGTQADVYMACKVRAAFGPELADGTELLEIPEGKGSGCL